MRTKNGEWTFRGVRSLCHGTDGASALGLGTLCAEAQADGVPCSESGRDCEKCDRAQKRIREMSFRVVHPRRQP